ncbi:MAG: AraC family transcriptional regulator [Oscillospiraceae bacterium]|nr:AraC family transcriptional regulator [Oscillospiraceae bacterium]
MKKEVRTVCFDESLMIEAVRFEGISQPFPNHFHDYYVIGLVLRGTRNMFCKDHDLVISGGDVLLLEPSDNHGCADVGGGTFDYIALNISCDVMRKLVEEVTGERVDETSTPDLPRFSENAVRNREIAELIERLHRLIFEDGNELEREETLLLLISNIIDSYGAPFLRTVASSGGDVERVCAFINEHYSERLRLDELCRVGRMSKSTLLRSFAKFKGITPYRYLQSVRINRAKELLENNVQPIDAAALTGFSDQSHFTNAFHTFFGLSPAAYGKIFEKEGRNNERKMRDDN